MISPLLKCCTVIIFTVNIAGCACIWPLGDGNSVKGRFSPSAEVLDAIDEASRATDVSRAYLLATAALESGFRPEAKAPTSSATGLYQFIEQTWLATLKNYGARHGLADIADAIQHDRRGRARVAGSSLKRKILDLRLDPYVSALMAAELACENAGVLRRALSREPQPTELYLAHVLGASGAARFLSTMEMTPQLAANRLFPEAAAANPTLFYQRTPRNPRSLDELFDVFDAKVQANI